MEKRLLTTAEVAARFNVTKETVQEWIRTGKMRAIKAGREFRIMPEWVEEFIAAGGTHKPRPKRIVPAKRLGETI